MTLSFSAFFSSSFLAAIASIFLAAVPGGALFCLQSIHRPFFAWLQKMHSLLPLQFHKSSFLYSLFFSGMNNASPCSSWFPLPAFLGLSGPSRSLSVSNASSDASLFVIFALEDIAAPLLVFPFNCFYIFTYTDD